LSRISIVSIDWQRVLPVIISIIIILLVAVLRQYSRTLAAVLATMPINVPLALWIIGSGDSTNRSGFAQFGDSMMLGMISTIVFVVIAWLAIRAGWGVVPVIVAGYIGWGITLLITLAARGALGK
jgi:hypothetical protein